MPEETPEEVIEETPEETESLESSEEMPGEEFTITSDQKRVSALDPDFILIVFFAMIMDGLDILFELLVIGKPFGILFDIFTFIIIVGWMSWRMGKIAESKKARQLALQRAFQQVIKRLEKLKKIGKVSDKVFGRYMRRYGQRMGKSGRLLTRIIRSPWVRSSIRGTLVLLGEIFWLIGLIPFWTISVIWMLREK